MEPIDIIRTAFLNLFGRFLHDILKGAVGRVKTRDFNHRPQNNCIALQAVWIAWSMRDLSFGSNGSKKNFLPMISVAYKRATAFFLIERAALKKAEHSISTTSTPFLLKNSL